MKRLLPLCLAAALGGCLYTNIHAPRAYRSAAPSDVKASATDETVTGKACSRSVLFLVAWGDAGYAAATRQALAGKPEAILYDVKSDIKATAVLLGLYSRLCTIVTAKAAKL